MSYLRQLARRAVRSMYVQIHQWQGSLWNRNTPPGEDRRGLDIGCGPRKRSGFIGADLVPVAGVDVICDLANGKWPFADNTFDVVNASHVFEHIADLDFVLSETARVIKHGAKLQVSLPYAGDLRAFQDPTHVRFFTLKTFEYYVAEGSRVGAWYQPKYFRQITRRHLVFGLGPLSLLMGLIVNRSQYLLDLYEASFLRVIAAKDLQVELEK